MSKRLSKLIAPDPKGEFPFEVTEYIIQAIHRLSRARDAAFETELVALGLNVTRYRILVAVVRAEHCTMSDLAALIGQDRTTLARAVEQLVASGLINREHVAADRRFVQLSPTAEGEAAYRATIPIAEAINARLFKGLAEADQRAVMRGLEPMLANLGVSPDDIDQALGPRWD